MTRAAVNGACLCGAIQYRATLPAKWVAHCHCSICRRAHGAGFVTWAGFSSGLVAVLSGAEFLSRYHSSALATRTFCSRCGSMLFFESGQWPGETHVTLASLESTEGLEPQAHAYWSSRAAWAIHDPGGLPTADPPDHDTVPQDG